MKISYLPANVKCCFGIIRAVQHIGFGNSMCRSLVFRPGLRSGWVAAPGVLGGLPACQGPTAMAQSKLSQVWGGGVGAESPHTAESNVHIVR